MKWQAEQAYNHLPPLPLGSDLGELAETLLILKACIPARAALAELKQAGELLPNQGLLINLLPLLEAQGSSEIENIVTTTDKLFQYAQEDSQADPMTKEALRYRTALYQGFTELTSRPLCVTTALEICSTISINGFGVIDTMKQFISDWMVNNTHTSISQFCGSLSCKGADNNEILQRVQYLKYFQQ